MTTVYDVEAEPLIEEAADEMSEMFDEPDWTSFTKTASNKDRPPQQENWYYIRASAILRRLYMDGPLGVSKLRTVFGSKEQSGHDPAHHSKASGKVIRTALQKLEEEGLVETVEGEGRKITEDGKSFLDEKAGSL